MTHYKIVDVIILGAGAAGLMCAIEAAKRHRNVMVLDHANKAGKKILMSGGGRCNFTNYHIHPDRYISHNKHFCKSALHRYTQWDFIDLVKRYQIPFHEKTLGQLFCDDKSKAILDMLLSECEKENVTIQLNTSIEKIEKCNDDHFKIKTTQNNFQCESLVIATGGLSIPSMGASPFGYKIAEQFGIPVWPTRAGLVPLTLHDHDKQKLEILSGVSVDCEVSTSQKKFRENLLFTHRGLSGPAILQASSYWNVGEEINIDMLPDLNLLEHLKLLQKQRPLLQIKTLLADFFPQRVNEIFLPSELAQKKLADTSHQHFFHINELFSTWKIKPNGTEGYRTAEVTLGGVDCDAISSKTFAANAVAGLYFIGEVLDVTGWLGGYNFQWAWSSGWCAGQVV